MGTQQSDNSQKALIKNKGDLEKYQNFDQYQQNVVDQPKQNYGAQQSDNTKSLEISLESTQQQSVVEVNLSNSIQTNLNDNQVQAFEVAYLQPVIVDDLQNQNFNVKKFLAHKALLLLIINQVCEIFCFVWMATYFTEYYLRVGPSFLIIYIPLYLIAISLSNCQYFKQFPKSIILNFIIIYLSSSVQIYMCSFFDDYTPPEEEGIQFSNADIIILAFIFLMLFKIIIQILMMVFLCFEQENLRFKFFLLYLVGFCLLILSYSYWFIPQLAICFFYAIFLMMAIKQSFSGRFSVKVNNVLSMANSLYFGTVFPCWIIK